MSARIHLDAADVEMLVHESTTSFSHSDTLLMKEVEEKMKRLHEPCNGLKGEHVSFYGDDKEGVDTTTAPGEQAMSGPMHLVGVGSNGDLPLAQLSSTVDKDESLLVQLSMIPEQDTGDGPLEFDFLPCDLQIAIVCYYFVRYSTLEEVVESGLLSQGTDEQLENLKLDFMKRRCDEYENHKYVSTSKKVVYYYHPSVIKRFGMETTRSIITLEILYSIFKSRIDHVRRLAPETLAPKDRLAFDPMTYIRQGGEEGVEYKLYHFLPGMSLIANELGFTETFAEKEDDDYRSRLNLFTFDGVVQTLEKTGLFRVMLSEKQYDMKYDMEKYMSRGRSPISFVDSINEMIKGLEDLPSTLGSNPIDESRRNVLAQWKDLIDQYTVFGEVDYQKYNAIAQWHMENGLYQSARSSGVNPMWKYFYGIKPIKGTSCLLDTQRFGFQLISRVRRILGEFAIGNTYDSMSLERATPQLKRTAATALAVEQDLHQTWHQKLDSYNRNDGISETPDWYRQVSNSLQWLYYKRNEDGTISVRGDSDDGGVSIFSDDFYYDVITKRLPLDTLDTPDTPPSADVLYVQPSHFSIFDLQELSNFNYNETGTIGFIDDPEFTEALKRVEEANSNLEHMVTERLWNKTYNTPNRNPIGMTTYASHDTIMGCREPEKGRARVLKCAEFSGDSKTKVVEQKVAVYEFAERSWDELKRERIRHPKYDIPPKVEKLRVKYELVSTSVVVKSGCFEGDSIPCIFLDTLRESENLCAYNAIKAYKRMIKIQQKQLAFLLCDVYPVLDAMWEMVKLKIDRCQQGSDMDGALLNDFKNSLELKSFRAKEREWKQHSYEAWDFSTMTEKTQHRQGYIDIDLEARLDRMRSSPTPFIDLCSELNEIHGALKTKVVAVLTEIDGIATTLYSSYRLAPVDSTWYNLLFIAARRYSITEALTLVRTKSNTGVFLHMKHIPETRALFADVYHHFCKGDGYKLGPVFQLVFRLKETSGPEELISIEEVHNQDKAYNLQFNSVNCVHAIAAFLRKKYAQHTAAGQLFVDRSAEITELEEKNYTMQPNIKEMHQILDDYYRQQAGGSEPEYERLKAAGLEERRNGYIPRRSMPSTGDEKVYPCYETLNSSMETMSYIDDRPIKAEIRDLYEVVEDLRTKLDKLRQITDNVTIDLPGALIAFEAVETAVEALLVNTSLRLTELNASEDKKESNQDRTLGMVEYRNAVGPKASGNLEKEIEVEDANEHSVLYYTEEEKRTIGISNSRDRFTEFQANKIFEGAFFCIVNPFDEDKNPLRNKMRNGDGRSWRLKGDPLHPPDNWLRQYEMMLLYTAQVLGNVFRYGGYRARNDSNASMFRLWRYPNYSSDIEKVRDSPTDTEDLQEDLRLYSGILDEEHPDQRSWSERMQGDRVNPPRWQTRTFNDDRNILHESMTVDESDMKRYMFTDKDSIVNTFCNVVDQWASLFEWTEETSKLGDDLESVTDSFQKHLIDIGLDKLTQPARKDPNGPNQRERRRRLEKFSNWGTIQDMNGILGLILDFGSNARKRIDILNNMADFTMDPFKRRLSSFFGAGFEPRIITPAAYPGLFERPRPSDMDKFKKHWIDKITDTQIDLVLTETNGVVPRWGGLYEDNTKAPDLESAKEELGKVEGSEFYDIEVGFGHALVKKLHQVGMEHANYEIEYYTESALHGPGYNNSALWNQIENNEKSINDKNSLYNIVRHAYYLSDLDKHVDPSESSSKKKSETMAFAADIIYKSIEASIKQLNDQRMSPDDFAAMIVRAMNDGIKETINQFSKKALQLATIETRYKYYGGKIAAFNTIVDKTLAEFNTPALKSVILISDVIKTVVPMEAASQGETPSLNIFENAQVSIAFKKYFEAKLPDGEKKMSMKEKKERTESWKRCLLILRALYKRIGFSKKQLKTATTVNAQVAQLIQTEYTWQAKFSTDQVDRRNKAGTMASHSQLRSIAKRDFTNTDQRQSYPANVVQSFKELARDIRLLTIGFQEPYFENPKAKQEFLNSIKTDGVQTAEELYTKTMELNKRKYPGFQDGVETFASIDRFKRQFYRLLESIKKHDSESRFHSKSFHRLEITDGVHYKKMDPLAASMAPNKRNASNENELALKGITTVELIIGGKPEWYALDLYLLYQNPNTQMLYNELRSLTVTSKIALDREFQLDNQRPMNGGGNSSPFELPEYISLVEKLNATKMQFEMRACMLIKRVVRQISTEMASPYSISNEVSEFIDSNPVDSDEIAQGGEAAPPPHGPLFVQIFQDLLGDLNKVVEFEKKWEVAIPRLQILRREDLYQRLRSNGNSDFNPQTLFLDSQPFIDFSDYDEDEGEYKTFRDSLGRQSDLYGIDLRVSTFHPDWTQLFQSYQEKAQSPTDNAERIAFGSMQNIGRDWERLAVPTAQEIVNVMEWFTQNGRDPRLQERRPPIRLVDTIDFNFYAYFVDIVCLSHAYPDQYMKSLAFAFEHRDISNTVIEEGQFPNGPIEIHGIALRSIYNPNNYASAVEEGNVDFYTTKRYFQNNLKDLEVPIQALAELIDNYNLFRSLPARNDSYPTQSIFENNDNATITRLVDLTRLPLNEKEFSLYMQNFLSRATTARFAAGIDDEVLKQSAYTVLNQNIAQLQTPPIDGTKMQFVYFIARFLKIPVYPRPADTQFANEQTYQRTISIGKRRWLQATKDDLEKANPRDYYDEEFVTRLELSKSIGEDEREDTDDAPIKDFALINMIEFESDVNRIHDSSPPRIVPQAETNGRAPLSMEEQNQGYEEAYTTWYNKDFVSRNNLRLVDSGGAIDWVEAAITVANGDCFYHSIVSNLGTLFPQHQWTLQFGILDNAVSNLKQLLMNSFQTAIDDLEQRLLNGNIPMEPLPYSNGYSRWKRCEYFFGLLADSGGRSLLKTNLFGAGGSYLADMHAYNDRINGYNLPELNESTSDLDILRRLCAFFRIDGVYANDMVIEMAVHTLQMPLLIYEDGQGVGWKHAVDTVNMRGEEYYHVGQPILLILRTGDHFKAIYPKHLATDSNRVIYTTSTDYVGNKRERVSMTTLPLYPVLIDIRTKKRGRIDTVR